MNDKKRENEALVKKYAPILWFHEDEAFLPEDCKVLPEVAELYRGKQREDFDHTLDDLVKIKESDECSLDIPDLDLEYFTIPREYHKSITELGPEAVAHLAKERYGNNPALGFPEKDTIPKYYGRVGHLKLAYRKGDPFSEYFRKNDDTIFGSYTVIQYFFFYIFNDSWNKHEGDWDSTLEILINEDNNRKYLVSHMHHTTWLAGLVPVESDLIAWLEEWNGLEKGDMGKAYAMNDHPYLFVARGAHGAYPTPGFSIHGMGLRRIARMIASVDERQIGRTCVLPEDEKVSEELIRTDLRLAKIDANRIKFFKWREPELFTNQPWLNFQGKWGQDTGYEGWDGPKGAWHGRKINLWNLKSRFSEGYKGKFYDKILLSWHGVR